MFIARRVSIRHTQAARGLRFYTPAHGSARLIEKDSVLLQPGKGYGGVAPVFIDKLESGSLNNGFKGRIDHDDIIGKLPGDVVLTKPAKSAKAPFPYILHKVSLDQYVTLSRRIVTPLYPHDAKVIVELLDLHPDTYDANRSIDEDRLEILEAGTGHGALTLYLSRAIHGANPSFANVKHTDEDHSAEDTIDAWKARRAAVLHSVELHKVHSIHAQKVVQGFRHGIYHRNVDFHVGDVSEWCRNRLSEQKDNEPFLSRAFLDLPGPENHLAAVTAALRVSGTLSVFNPSITQIIDTFSCVKEQGMPLWLEKVVELGNNGASGGREWDVRAVRPRAYLRAATEAIEVKETEVESDPSSNDQVANDTTEAVEGTPAPSNAAEGETDGWKMICRPKVGERITGGGFLAVFRKRQPSTSSAEGSE